ncbi:MAG TPA: glycosyltransferase family 2 protein [Actinomycetota bacterium]
MNVRRLTIAIPVFNEERRVEAALKEVLDTTFPVDVEIIVVDDGSTDRTRAILSSMSLPGHVRVIEHPENRGKGAALRTALAEAAGDVFVPFDADLEYAPNDLRLLLTPLIDGEADVVFGTRAFGSHTAFNYWFVVGNRVLTTWTNILFNCYLSDMETCFKMARTDVLRSLDLRSDGFDIEPEVTAKILRAGYRPFEIAIQYKARTREEGKKITWRDGLRALWIVARIRFVGR